MARPALGDGASTNSNVTLGAYDDDLYYKNLPFMYTGLMYKKKFAGFTN